MDLVAQIVSDMMWNTYSASTSFRSFTKNGIGILIVDSLVEKNEENSDTIVLVHYPVDFKLPNRGAIKFKLPYWV